MGEEKTGCKNRIEGALFTGQTSLEGSCRPGRSAKGLFHLLYRWREGARLPYLWLPRLVGRPSAPCDYQPGVVAHLCNFATGGLVSWTVGRRGPLVVLDHVEPASALSAASAWASRGSPWRPGGLESRAPGQALQGAAQTGRVVQ